MRNAKPGNLCSSALKQQSSVARRVAGQWLESLERRRLYSAGSTLGADGILTVVGTDNADHVTVYKRLNLDGSATIVVNAQSPTSSSQSGFGGEFDLSRVRGIRIYGMGGDDLINVLNDPSVQPAFWDATLLDPAKSLNVPVTLNGGAGDDNLYSESGADDVIVGGAGDDHSYVVDGHDRFAVEFVENYRDAKFLGADDGGGWSGGCFTWNGPQGQLFDDPWLVPNRDGTYFGPNAPHFDDGGDGGDGRGGSTGGSGDHHHHTLTDNSSTDSATDAPVALPPVTVPPSIFSTAPVDQKHHDVWAEGAE